MIPKEGLPLIQQSNGCVHTFLQKACVQFYPYVIQRAVSLTSTHPHQGPSTPFNNYFMKVDFYYNMLGLIEKFRVSLGDTYYQDCFITHLQNATAIEEQVHWEQASLDPQDCHKYSNGMFIQNLFSIAHSLQRISSNPARLFATNKLHSMESTLHVLDGNELHDYCVHGIDIDDCEPSKCQHFEQAIHAVSSNFSKFDTTKLCALCGNPGHMFDNCPEVMNPNLKECYICARLACNRFKRSIDDLGIKDVHVLQRPYHLVA